MQDNEQLMTFGAGDATLTALILAQQLGVKPITKKLSSHNAQNPDPESFYGKGGHFVGKDRARNPIDKAFVDLAQKANPKFDPNKQMQETLIDSTYVNYPGAMSRNSKVDPETFTVKHNYGVDRAVYAHELGHVLAQNTPGQRQVNELRRLLMINPKLNEAMGKGLDMLPKDLAKKLAPSVSTAALFKGSRLLAPAIAAGMIEGDDDLAASLATTVAMTAPVLADEAIASMNGLKIMKEAGDPATMKQRGRYAAALGNYLVPALIAAAGGNVVGNLLD
jgi:hypothetical protein